jgi:hypothetical protein
MGTRSASWDRHPAKTRLKYRPPAELFALDRTGDLAGTHILLTPINPKGRRWIEAKLQ